MPPEPAELKVSTGKDSSNGGTSGRPEIHPDDERRPHKRPRGHTHYEHHGPQSSETMEVRNSSGSCPALNGCCLDEVGKVYTVAEATCKGLKSTFGHFVSGLREWMGLDSQRPLSTSSCPYEKKKPAVPPCPVKKAKGTWTSQFPWKTKSTMDMASS